MVLFAIFLAFAILCGQVWNSARTLAAKMNAGLKTSPAVAVNTPSTTVVKPSDVCPNAMTEDTFTFASQMALGGLVVSACMLLFLPIWWYFSAETARLDVEESTLERLNETAEMDANDRILNQRFVVTKDISREEADQRRHDIDELISRAVSGKLLPADKVMFEKITTKLEHELSPADIAQMKLWYNNKAPKSPEAMRALLWEIATLTEGTNIGTDELVEKLLRSKSKIGEQAENLINSLKTKTTSDQFYLLALNILLSKDPFKTVTDIMKQNPTLDVLARTLVQPTTAASAVSERPRPSASPFTSLPSAASRYGAAANPFIPVPTLGGMQMAFGKRNRRRRSHRR